jgi:hypothetical protein
MALSSADIGNRYSSSPAPPSRHRRRARAALLLLRVHSAGAAADVLGHHLLHARLHALEERRRALVGERGERVGGARQLLNA